MLSRTNRSTYGEQEAKLSKSLPAHLLLSTTSTKNGFFTRRGKAS